MDLLEQSDLDTNVEKEAFIVNEEIKGKNVRLVHDGTSDVVSREKALEMADELDLDLIQIANPDGVPVCKIDSLDRFKYRKQKEEQKRQKLQRESARKQEIKELHLRVEIDSHDLGIKLNHAKEFFREGRRVKWVLRFRGREMSHASRAEALLAQIKSELADFANPGSVEKEGKKWQQTWVPKTA